MRALILTAVALCSMGCSSGAASTAAANVAVAVTVSAVRRANGECFTPCNPGTFCDPKTGLCEPLPCGGTCRSDESCERTAVSDRCVPRVELQVRGVASVPPETPDAGTAPAPTEGPARAPPTLLPK